MDSHDIPQGAVNRHQEPPRAPHQGRVSLIKQVRAPANRRAGISMTKSGDGAVAADADRVGSSVRTGLEARSRPVEVVSTASSGSPLTPRPVGWYPGPGGGAEKRYWDGSRWSSAGAPGNAFVPPS